MLHRTYHDDSISTNGFENQIYLGCVIPKKYNNRNRTVHERGNYEIAIKMKESIKKVF